MSFHQIRSEFKGNIRELTLNEIESVSGGLSVLPVPEGLTNSQVYEAMERFRSGMNPGFGQHYEVSYVYDEHWKVVAVEIEIAADLIDA